MIRTIKNAIKEIFSLKQEIDKDHLECSIDEEVVDCEGKAFTQDALNYYSSYVGVPSPAYLGSDPWFSEPVYSEKQLTVKEAHEQAVADQQILDESESKESADIHQKLYERATANWNTVEETQLAAQGGSENFHEGPGGWTSGNGQNQFR